jgi:hypothetical protein
MTFDNVGGLSKTLLDAINCKSRVRMETADVSVVCPALQQDIAAFPVANPENNVFFLNFCQRAILTRIVQYPND